MKYNKNVDILFLLLLITTGRHEKNIEKIIICECRLSKKVKNRDFWEYFTTTSTES